VIIRIASISAGGQLTVPWLPERHTEPTFIFPSDSPDAPTHVEHQANAATTSPKPKSTTPSHPNLLSKAMGPVSIGSSPRTRVSVSRSEREYQIRRWPFQAGRASRRLEDRNEGKFF
jgi:hypothetical protein